MATVHNYLTMQKNRYDRSASRWDLENRNPVVGSYDAHNEWKDYDEFLFKGIDTTGKSALEYGAGPGRNLIKFKDRFRRIDGVDISSKNKEKALLNCKHNSVEHFNYFVCDGKSIPCKDESYDVVFSVICLQHICCHSIRYSILKECYRVLKPEGHLCFQMGYGGKNPGKLWSKYKEDNYSARDTNGHNDVSITDINEVELDLNSIGFRTFDYDIRPVGPGDNHKNWIFIRTQK